MIYSIIVDDEIKAIKTLEWELGTYCPEVKVLERFQRVQDAIDFLKDHDVQLVFLDMEISDSTGLQLLDAFDNPEFYTIVISAHDEYAIKSARHHVFDYILKPIDSDELVRSISHLASKLEKNSIPNQIDERLRDLLNRENEDKKVSIRQDNQILFLKVKDLEYLKGHGSYCEIHLSSGETCIVSKSVKHTLELIDADDTFFRVHNSYAVNLRKVVRYDKSDALLFLESGASVPVSRYRKDQFIKTLEE